MLNADQQDCLQEITNVAMGAAAEALAELSHQFVHLPIPRISSSTVESLARLMNNVAQQETLIMVSQPCRIADMDCVTLLLARPSAVSQLQKVDVDSNHLNTLTGEEELLKVFDRVNPICLQYYSEYFEQADVTDASIISHWPQETINGPTLSDFLCSEEIVMADVDYQMESHPFACHWVLLVPQTSVSKLTHHLDLLL